MKIETFDCKITNVPEDIIIQTSELLTEVFSNNWPEAYFCLECDTKQRERMRFSYSQITDLERSKKNTPCCPQCRSEMIMFYDKTITVQHLQKTFRNNCRISLLKSKNNEVIGIIYGYETSIREIFENEWAEEYPFADIPESKRIYRDFNEFMKKITMKVKKTFHQEVTPETNAFGLNCLVLHASHRNKRNTYKMTQALIDILPANLEDTLTLGHALKGNVAHSLFTRAGAVEIEGVYTKQQKPPTIEGEYVLVVAKTKSYIDFFSKQF